MVISIAFSHNSTWIVSASQDGTVKVWDVSSGGCLRSFEGHSGAVMSVAFSHDSAHIASASYDKTVRVWGVDSGVCLRTLKGHHNQVNSVVFSHDSTWLASASTDQTVRIWDANSGICLHILDRHYTAVFSVAFSYDSTRLASATVNEVHIWDTSSGELGQTNDLAQELYETSVSGFRVHRRRGAIAFDDVTHELPIANCEAVGLLRTRNVRVSLDNKWIACDGMPVLRLPPKYRTTASVASGNIIGISVGSGRIWMCHLP